MPDVVFEETFKGSEKIQIEILFTFGFVKSLEITDRNVLREYYRLKSKFGKGESACMAYCRFNDDVIGSSNLSDIKYYCNEHNITYLTTLDFLAEAYNKNILSESECDYFIYKADGKNKIPFRSIVEYIEFARKPK